MKTIFRNKRIVEYKSTRTQNVIRYSKLNGVQILFLWKYERRDSWNLYFIRHNLFICNFFGFRQSLLSRAPCTPIKSDSTIANFFRYRFIQSNSNQLFKADFRVLKKLKYLFTTSVYAYKLIYFEFSKKKHRW